jgi:hypothetical protein
MQTTAWLTKRSSVNHAKDKGHLEAHGEHANEKKQRVVKNLHRRTRQAAAHARHSYTHTANMQSRGKKSPLPNEVGRRETHLHPRGEHADQKKQHEGKNRRPIEHHRRDYHVGTGTHIGNAGRAAVATTSLE